MSERKYDQKRLHWGGKLVGKKVEGGSIERRSPQKSVSSFVFVFVFLFVLFLVVQCHSFSGGGRRACVGRLRPSQSILRPSCRCKQVSFLFKSFKIFSDLGLRNFWAAKYFHDWGCTIFGPQNIFRFGIHWYMCKSTSKDITQAQTFRSLATVRLVFTRTIGYYFLRTYFPLIIIVFWWGKAWLGICQCQCWVNFQIG